tara:strand:+ start:4174 stop:5475 length:1302 start_codon:yes stop_codon:yes gene_type:complete
MKNLTQKKDDSRSFTPYVAVVGLGYVGLPLAIALSKFHKVIGLDTDENRVKELTNGFDRTGEFISSEITNMELRLTSKPNDICLSKIFIIAVPTPVDKDNKPDLSSLRSASETVGTQMRKGSIIVYESTVWPGVTEDICAPILQETSGLKAGVDFFLGYSPERVNPGDKEHTIDKITKIVSAQTPEICNTLSKLYGQITKGKIHVSPNIRTAEAAKVIENAQRDINIAFINEIAQICQKLEISVYEVLEAAETKWNFLKFKPGLVGGHCIGVDPYYLAYRARELGYDPSVLLTGRKINDGMGKYISDQILHLLEPESNILILGLTFKEDVSDLRNSQVEDIIKYLESSGHTVSVSDPHASQEEAMELYGIKLNNKINEDDKFDCVLCCVGHSEYRKMNGKSIAGLLKKRGLLADIKGIWRNIRLDESYRRWTL